MDTQKKTWFKAKEYGWGWSPASWQGWLITIIYIIGLIHYAIQSYRQNSVSDTILHFAIDFVILTGFYLAICSYTGEKLGWRWGKKEEAKIEAKPVEASKTEDNNAPQPQQ